MKKLLITILLGISHQLMGQITILSSDCVVPVSPDSIPIRRNSMIQYPSPSHGQNQNWDYSSMLGGNIFFSLEQSIIFDGYYSTATGMRTYNPSLGNITLQNSREYYRQDANGFHILGFRTDSNFFDISNDGGPGSYLNFPKSYVVHNNYKQLSFPMTYGDKWVFQGLSVIPYVLNITNFGIFNQNGELRQYLIDSTEVVGYGTVKYPGSNNDYQALLLKRNYSRTDSIYLDGSPANPLLLQQFGVTQGQKTEYYDHYIYIKGIGVPAISFYYPSLTATLSTVTEYSGIHPQTTSNQSSSNLTTMFVFPNPTKETVQFSKDLDLNIYDIHGRLLISVPNYKAFDIVSLNNLPQGVYVYQSIDAEKNVFSGKILKD